MTYRGVLATVWVGGTIALLLAADWWDLAPWTRRIEHRIWIVPLATLQPYLAKRALWGRW